VTKAKAIGILNETYDGFLIAEKMCLDTFKDEITDRKIALLTAIDALEQDNEWISVKDRMPEEGVDVLVYGYIYLNRKGADVDFVDGESGNFFYYDEGEVTHWRPLPEPPESAEIMEAIAGSETSDRAERSMR
jgi:hypothetical protein